MFSKVAVAVAHQAGKPWATAAAFVSVLAWAALGPHYGWSEGHQLAINTGTTIVTFLMVFLLQASQNRDGAAVQLKLDAVILALEQADNRVIGMEERSEEEALALRATIRDPSSSEPAEGRAS